MKRMYQVFAGPEGWTPAHTDRAFSPWRFPEEVRIPMEHWQAILDFAGRQSPAVAALLEQAAGLDGEVMDKATEADLLEVLDRLTSALPNTRPLTPVDADPAVIPEPMPNSVHAEMLGDIAYLLRQLRVDGYHFDAWVD